MPCAAAGAQLHELRQRACASIVDWQVTPRQLQIDQVQSVLVHFALERILYHLTQSQHADRFVLKGALLFTLWYDMPHRAKRDADLLGFRASDLEPQKRQSPASEAGLSR